MNRILTVLTMTAAALLLGSAALPASAAETPAKLPVLAVCLGTSANAGTLGTFTNRPVSKPAALIVDCPQGGDDDPRGISSDTIMTDITWSKWGRKSASGSGTLNVPGMKCTYTSPQNGTPSEVATMCSTCGEICNVQITTPYPVAVQVSKPVAYKKQKTFTKIAVTYTTAGPSGKTAQTFTPPRRASE